MFERIAMVFEKVATVLECMGAVALYIFGMAIFIMSVGLLATEAPVTYVTISLIITGLIMISICLAYLNTLFLLSFEAAIRDCRLKILEEEKWKL
jgi:hypothetical protein